MPQNPNERAPIYRTFLLSLWQEAGGKPVWRCSLEDPHAGERTGFRGIDELASYLLAWIQSASTEEPR